MKLAPSPALSLLHSAPYATLATQSVQLPGYPYATVVPNVLDALHCPLLLVSALAEHTKNLLADSRVSLSVVEGGTAEVQSAARLTLLGDAQPIATDDAPLSRYLRYQPEAAQYLELDFMFFRIVPKRIRFIAGVGKMGWLDSTDWEQLDALPPLAEHRVIDELLPPSGMTLLGIDRYGFDFTRNGQRQRRDFSGAPLADPEIVLAANRLFKELAP